MSSLLRFIVIFILVYVFVNVCAYTLCELGREVQMPEKVSDSFLLELQEAVDLLTGTLGTELGSSEKAEFS